MTKIGIDASRANALHRTGTEWYAFHVIQELKKIIPQKHEVILYSKEPLHGDLAVLPTNWNSRVLQWPPRFLWTQIRLAIEMLLNKPDVLFVPAHTFPLITPKRAITVIHDVGFVHEKNLYTPLERAYHRFAAHQAKKRASHIITVSEFSKKEIENYYHIPAENITVIPNGFNTREATSTTELPEQISTPYLLYIGRLEEKKNIARLIEAFALLKKQYQYPGKLVLVGFRGFGIKKIDQLINDNALTTDVIQTGWVSEEQLNVLMRQAHAFVFPSLYEGFGIPILEAMNIGIPVICSDIPALKEVAGDAAVFFDPLSPSDMAKKMQTLVTDEVIQKKLQQKGLDRVHLFSWEKTAQSVWNILQNEHLQR